MGNQVNDLSQQNMINSVTLQVDTQQDPSVTEETSVEYPPYTNNHCGFLIGGSILTITLVIIIVYLYMAYSEKSDQYTTFNVVYT